ncbi:hypothetical protein DMUE_6038 [Dictyocoela muelleri]|nr:hypothetical protein DMUE_6038 [Dictyocoela muelleri]
MHYIKGDNNIAADHISRCLIMYKLFKYDLILIKKFQDEDTKIQEYLKANKFQTIKINDFNIITEYQKRIIIPENYSYSLIKQLHIYFGHPGVNKFYETIKIYLNF